MKVLLFGATGMVGQGVLRECLLDPGTEVVQTVGRKASGAPGSKLMEVVHQDLWSYDAIEGQLAGFDACFFCLGVTSAGITADEYELITYGIATAAAKMLVKLNPEMTFVFVSGLGADSTEQGRIMWARVKGKTENALLRLPFRAVYVFRPGFIQPLHGIRSRTAAYRILYVLFRPLMPLLRNIFPNHILTTEDIGKAMLLLAHKGATAKGAQRRVLEPPDIRALLSAPADL